MTDNITRLKEALEGVAPAGPWSRHGATVEIQESDKWARVTIQCCANKLINRKVAAYVAAANPGSIRELLERLEQAEKDARRYRALRSIELQMTKDFEFRAGLCVDLWGNDGCGVQVSGDALDAAVDAAIASQEGD